MPAAAMTATVGTGSATASSLSTSSRTRSRDSAIRSLARAAHAASPAGVGRAGAEARVEAEEAQDAQVILGDAVGGHADEADAAGGEVGDAAEEVVDPPGQRVGVERVDREVAPRGVGPPVVGEGDGGVAAVGRDVAAQRRHLGDEPVGDRGDGAVGDAGRHRLDPGGGQAGDDLVGGELRREVDVARRSPRAARRAPRRRRAWSGRRRRRARRRAAAPPGVASHAGRGRRSATVTPAGEAGPFIAAAARG